MFSIKKQQARGESSSELRDIFSKMIAAPPVQKHTQGRLYATWVDTPLGQMVAIANKSHLYLLEFIDRQVLARSVRQLLEKTQSAISFGTTPVIEMIQQELKEYFQYGKTTFHTPMMLLGSNFQKKVWRQLMALKPGDTCSYTQLAIAIGQPTACRAVAGANGRNQLAIIIPCHRVINANGNIGGYGGGVERKAWLIEHEQAGSFS